MPKLIRTNPNYWDCECQENFIHSKEKGNFCKKCGTFESEQPDSRELEIKTHYDWTKDNAVNEKTTRTVYFCPKCGWESFEKDDYGQPCGQTGCKGKLTKVRKEEYQV